MKLPNKLFLAFLLLSAIGYLGQAQGLPLLSTNCFSQEDTTSKANEHFLAGNKLLEAGNYAAADAEFKKAQELLKAAPAKSKPAPQTSVTSVTEQYPEPPLKKPIPKPAKTERKKAQPELNIPRNMTPEEAIALYLRASELLPRTANLHYNLAIAYLKAKQYPRAAEAFKKAIRINPKDKGFSYTPLDNFKPDEELIKLMPEELSRQTQAVPVKMENNTLHIAMAEPSDLYAIDQIQMQTGMPLEISLSGTDEIKEAINKIAKERSAIKDLLDGLAKAGADASVRATVAQGSSIVKLVDVILAQAVRDHASDIHIEPEQEIPRIRFRIDGILHEIPAPPKEREIAMISRIKRSEEHTS